jgi:uncharacterized membrane protein
MIHMYLFFCCFPARNAIDKSIFRVLEGALKVPLVVHFAACAVLEAVLILSSFCGKMCPRLDFWAHLDPFWPSYWELPMGVTFG